MPALISRLIIKRIISECISSKQLEDKSKIKIIGPKQEKNEGWKGT